MKSSVASNTAPLPLFRLPVPARDRETPTDDVAPTVYFFLPDIYAEAKTSQGNRQAYLRPTS
jgi:hypothetical protein